MDISDMGAESKHGVKGDAEDLGGLIERSRCVGDWDLKVGIILMGPGGEKGDVGLGRGDGEAVKSGPVLDGGEVGGQGGLQLGEVRGGTDC